MQRPARSSPTCACNGAKEGPKPPPLHPEIPQATKPVTTTTAPYAATVTRTVVSISQVRRYPIDSVSPTHPPR